jgi:hypothetical protein
MSFGILKGFPGNFKSEIDFKNRKSENSSGPTFSPRSSRGVAAQRQFWLGRPMPVDAAARGDGAITMPGTGAVAQPGQFASGTPDDEVHRRAPPRKELPIGQP